MTHSRKKITPPPGPLQDTYPQTTAVPDAAFSAMSFSDAAATNAEYSVPADTAPEYAADSSEGNLAPPSTGVGRPQASISRFPPDSRNAGADSWNQLEFLPRPPVQDRAGQGSSVPDARWHQCYESSCRILICTKKFAAPLWKRRTKISFCSAPSVCAVKTNSHAKHFSFLVLRLCHASSRNRQPLT